MLLYNTETGKTTYFVELDGNSNQPIVIDLTYVQATAPNNPQENDTWFDTTNNVIKTYKDGQWTKTGDPNVGVFYFYNNEYYLWDGNSLEKTDLNIYEKVENKSTNIDPTTANNTTYPTTQAVVNYVTTQSIIRNFTEAGITKTTNSDTFTGPNGLAEEIRSKGFPTGTTLYGEVRNQGMPEGINNAEIRVEILETKDTGTPKHQVIEFTLFSVDVPPKEWSHIYFDQRTEEQNPWIWIPKSVPTDDYTSDSTNTVPSSKALSDGLASVTGANLFDIKLLSQAVVNNEGKTDKGWACLSHTTRKDIAKASVPTLYENIKDKYDNCDRGTLPITDLSSVSVPLLYEDGYYYFLDKNDYKTLKKSNNLDLSSPITVCDLTNYITTSNPPIYIVKGNNSYGILSLKSGVKLFIFNNDWTIRYSVDVIYYNVTEDVVKYIDGYYYILSDRKILMRVSESTGESETLATDIPAPAYSGDGSFCGDMIKVGNYIFYNYWVRNNSSCICRVDITDGSYISKSFTLYRGNYSTLMYENNTLFFFCNYTTTHYKYVSTDLGENWTENTINGISNEGQAQSIQKIDNTYYLALDTGIYTSTDLVNFTLFMNKGVALSHWKAFYNENNDLIVITSLRVGNFFYCNYSYTGVAKTVYTDTYQINGSSVAINYYKFNDWKICLPNAINDTNLDTVYNFLGYLNYWRLDTTSGSETISLPRNSNLWTMMYVGDDYEDSNLPTGSFSNAPKKIIGTSAPTTTTVGSVGDIFVDVTNVKIYVCTNVYWDSTINNNEGAYVYVWTLQNETDINNLLPSQTGNTDKFLTTNGTTVSWAEVQSGGSSATLNFFEGSTGTTLNTNLDLGNSVMTFKNGVLLEQMVDYTISGSTLTFLTPLVATDKIGVVNGYLSAIDMTGYTKTINFTNISVLATDWVIDNTYTNYDFKCVISGLLGVTANSFAQVIFAPTEADSCNYSTVCETGNGTVTIYSKVDNAITIPNIVIMGE